MAPLARHALLLCVAVAAVDVAWSTAPAAHVHVRVRAAASPSASSASSAMSLVCPLGDSFGQVPVIVLPCPHDCGHHDTATRACIVYPTAFQAYCGGSCVTGDTCVVQCLDVPNATSWVVTPDANASTLDGEWPVDSSIVQSLEVLDGTTLPLTLEVVSVDRPLDLNETNTTFNVPATFFDRLGKQLTSISLSNVVLDESVESDVVLTKLTKLRVTHSRLETCPLEPSQLPSVELLDLSNNRIRAFNGSGFQCLLELNLSRNDIGDFPSGSLPAQLQVLDLSANMLTRFPGALSTLAALRTAIFDHNAIQTIPRNAFRNASALSYLSLVNMSLSVVPSSLIQLKKLSFLRLDGNDLSNSPASNFSRLTKSLSYLSVNNASLRQLPTGLQHHLKLSSLSLASNNFSTTSALNGTILPKLLTTLDLSSNRLRQLPTALSNLTRLTALNLSDNALEGRVDARRLPSTLMSLSLDRCKLPKLPENVVQLSKLQTLSLRGNPLEGAFPVDQLPSVTSLHLDDTSIHVIDTFSTSSVLEILTCENCTELSSLPPLPASLTSLSLSRIAMKTLPRSTLPTKLRSLNITDTSILTAVPEDLPTLTELLDLSISRCNLSEFAFSSGFGKLQALSLLNNSISSFSASLPLVQTLTLANNRLRAFNMSNVTRLVRLNLAYNELEEFPRAVLSMETLQRLRLEGNPIRGFQPDEDALKFLKNLSFLGMTQDQLATDCASPTRIKQFSVCVKTQDPDTQNPGPQLAGSEIAKTGKSPAEKKRSSVVIMVLDVLLVMGIGAAVAFILRRDKREHRDQIENEKKALYAARAAEMSPAMATVDVNVLAAFRIEKDALVKSRRIGEGIHGEVWLAIYASQRVAVKQLKPDEATPEVVQQFTQEAKLLSDLQHPNIVAFVGVAWQEVADLAVVTVFAGNGDVRNYLQSSDRPSDGSWDLAKVEMALGVAEALAYLHSLHRPVIHRDLQSKNVLLDDKFDVKLAGFHVAIRARRGHKASPDDTLLTRVGVVRWLAPELLTGSRYDVSVDIFSLGVILSELDTHARPYASVHDETGQPIGNDDVKMRVADGTLRLALSPTCPRAIADLALRCSSFDRHDRPRAADVVTTLRELQSSLKDTSVSL